MQRFEQEPKHKKPKIVKIATGIFLPVLLIASAFLYNIFYGANDFDGVEKKTVYISKGQTWEQTVDSLEMHGVIRSRAMFEFVVRVLRKGTQTHVGKYEFSSGISNADLYYYLRVGKGNVPIAVTLREGRRAVHFARAFQRTLGIDTVRFMNLMNDAAFAHSLDVDADNLEGYLAPNTYNFIWQTDEEEIIRRLVRQRQKEFTDTLQSRAKELNMIFHNVLTLAAIIEGETFLDDERPIISGVYHNRLRKGMRLEADPTIQFIIPDGPRRVLHKDLRIDHPYNTYLNYGLPPGPINNPQRASILAALYPARHNYIFFVSNGRGGHWFAETYAGHLHNVRKFRRERALQIRSQGG